MGNYKALVVEDVDVAQKMMKLTLEECDIDVTLASGGMDAIDLYEQQNFDLVLVDVGLPDTDGFTIAETIRELDKNKVMKPLVVAVTVHADQQYRELAEQSGFDDYFVKPFTPAAAKKLLTKLRTKKSEDGKVVFIGAE